MTPRNPNFTAQVWLRTLMEGLKGARGQTSSLDDIVARNSKQKTEAENILKRVKEANK